MGGSRFRSMGVLLVGYAILIGAVAWLSIVLGGFEALLPVMMVGPLVFAASAYPRRIYLIVIVLLSAASLWVITRLSTDLKESLEAFLTFTVVVTVIAELVHRLSAGRKQIERESRSWASFVAEYPDPVLRVGGQWCGPDEQCIWGGFAEVIGGGPEPDALRLEAAGR